MLIDNEEHIRVVPSQAFDLAGYQVQTFEPAEQALERLEAHNGSIKDAMATLGLLRKTLYDRMIDIAWRVKT